MSIGTLRFMRPTTGISEPATQFFIITRLQLKRVPRGESRLASR